MEFKPWPKTPRLFRDIVITEKIDGTNAAIHINRITPEEADVSLGHVTFDGTEYWEVGAQSRNRLIFPGKQTDNYGFAGWVYENAYSLRTVLGEGTHYGEWWGKGIARGYGQERKQFSLFNVNRYAHIAEETDGLLDVVPTLYAGPYSEHVIHREIGNLRAWGSVASVNYMNPEGVVVYHTASGQVYKALLENDELPKGKVPYSEKVLTSQGAFA